VSRHLKVLADAGWVTSRAEGTSRVYAIASLDSSDRRLWQLVRERVEETVAARHDVVRLQRVLTERRERSREFFSTAAGQWDALRAELFGDRADIAALLGLLDENWTVGDLGCGTGRISASLAPFVRQVVAVDDSRAMLNAARRRLADAANVDFRQGDLESLPVGDGELDAAVLALVLNYVAEPARALAEVQRALKPGGRMLVVDMQPHERGDLRLRTGQVWQGLAREQMVGWLSEAGFSSIRYSALQPDAQAKGPTLFVCTARTKLKAES
jgi:ArsR family transcriptional regulator